MKKIGLVFTMIMLMMLFGCTKEAPTEMVKEETASPQELTQAEATAIAREAYVYGFPMVVNYKTMYMYSINEESPEYKGPFNYLGCDARVFTLTLQKSRMLSR